MLDLLQELDKEIDTNICTPPNTGKGRTLW